MKIIGKASFWLAKSNYRVMKSLINLERRGIITESERLELFDLIYYCRTSGNDDAQGETST